MHYRVLPLVAMAFLSACTTPLAEPVTSPPAASADAQVLDSRSIRLQSASGEAIEILAEIADEPQARARGLMFRDELQEGAGMLFMFEEEQPLDFWMKNTIIPLDVLFFDSEGAFVSSAAMIPCTADPCPTYPSAGPARYALEVNAGFDEEQGVGEGWRLLIE